MVTSVPPVLVTVSERDLLFPTVTLPKLRLPGLAPRVPVATPAPDKGIVRVGFDALDAMVMLPLALPADDGLKKTVKFALWPAAKVRGAEIPLMLNPLPLIAT